MSARNELSTKNKWWIERYRYLELKYFCRQYPIWKKAYRSLHGLSQRPNDLELFKKKRRSFRSDCQMCGSDALLSGTNRTGGASG